MRSVSLITDLSDTDIVHTYSYHTTDWPITLTTDQARDVVVSDIIPHPNQRGECCPVCVCVCVLRPKLQSFAEAALSLKLSEAL